MCKTCIILANFGTTHLNGLKSILNIKREISNSFKNIPVKVTFTSNIIRRIWKKRKNEKEKWLKLGIPEDILNVKGIISTIGEAIEEEFENIIVQPTHLFYMEQVHDLYSYIKAFQSIKTMQKKWMPFKKIVMGRPALGMFSDKYYYLNDMKKAILTLKDDVEQAENKKASLFYMAHGNKNFPNGIFYEIEDMFNEIYNNVNIVIACVEGNPCFEKSIKKLKNQKILLKPFMTVAGVHAEEDMTEWRDKLIENGFSVEIIKKGLGENNDFAKIFVEHIKDVASDNEIEI